MPKFLPPLALSASLLAIASPARADDATSEAEIVVTASIDRYAPRTLAAILSSLCRRQVRTICYNSCYKAARLIDIRY